MDTVLTAPSPNRLPLVAVIGDGTLATTSTKLNIAEDLGQRLVEAGYGIVCGGLGGVMEAACRGAHRAENYRPGLTIGILPLAEDTTANPFVDICLPTSLSHGRNLIVAHAPVVIAIGGGAGTLCEMSYAWILNRLIIGLRVQGWSGELADSQIDTRTRFTHIPDDCIWGADSAAEAIELLHRHRARYL